MSAVGFDSGIVMSSGRAADVVGPNESDGTTTEFDLPGDADLDLLVAPDTTEDASVLMFDFVPTASTVQFEYVFSSEEYNEFVNEYNDVFAFYVNGTNCATVPGTNPPLPVSINTINGGNPFGTGAVHPALYRNNSGNDPGPATIDTEMDGLTIVLTCEASVNANVTNTMKLAIADTNDQELDTAVFLRARSFVVPAPPVCNSQSVTVMAGETVGVTPVATDPNPVDQLTYSFASDAAHGTVLLRVTMSGGVNGSPSVGLFEFSYTPDPGYTGPDSFTFSASDGTFTCDPLGTIDITVTPRPVPAPIVPPRFAG